MESKGRVTGFGGIFFKTSDPDKTKQWYYDKLKLVPNDYGSLLDLKTVEGESEEIVVKETSKLN